jgi:hypothetical protein
LSAKIKENNNNNDTKKLRRDLFIVKKKMSDIMAISRETLAQTLGDVSIDVFIEGEMKVDLDRYRLFFSTLIHISTRFKDHMLRLQSEMRYLRLLINKLLIWRSELCYQKKFLLKTVDVKSSSKSNFKFRKLVHVIIALNKMM